ncbi:MAG: glycosyltransferase family 39 protein [Leptospira sp.]|nr:glycosyltransferase family 39 protein [Leptospira sp.]
MTYFKNLPSIIWLSFLLFFLLQIGNWGPLFDQDEAAYAGFAKQMLKTGDYFTQQFPFSEPHRKPPLHIWFTALSFHIFGINEFVLRIFPTLWITLTCVFTYLITKQIFDEKTALRSFFILATTLYFPLNGKISLVDSLLTFTETLGFYALVMLTAPDKKKSNLYIALFWFSISLGTLVKGPPILIYLGGICFVFLLHKRTRNLIFDLKPWFFLPIALLPLFLWGYIAWQKTNGELIRWMIDWYVLRRATDPVFGQSGPPGVYLVLFFITLLPWSIYLPLVGKKIWTETKNIVLFYKGKVESININYMLIVSGLIFGWVFYEFMSSKLPSYPLAAYPILSLLIANASLSIQNQKLYHWLTKIAILQFVFVNIIFSIYFNTLKTDTKRIAGEWNQILSENDHIYAVKNFGLPSLPFYLNAQIIESKGIEFSHSYKKDSILLIDEENFQLLNALGIKMDMIATKQKIWEYDRNKNIFLMLVKIK